VRLRTGVWLGCGILAGCALLGGLLLVGLVLHVARDPAGLRAYVESPDEVKVGELFELRVVVANDRQGRGLKVSSIDLGESYLAGFVVRATEPSPKSSQRVSFDNSQSFRFDVPVPAGGTNVFTFRLRAARPGLYRGDVDICEGMRFLTVMAQTAVKQ